MIKVLFLAANPSDTARLRLDEESRAIDAAIRQGDYRHQFDIHSHWAVRISDLQELLLRHQPHIVHFCGHGSSTGELILQDDHGNALTVSAEGIRKLFAVLKDNIKCVVLSACYSETQARSIAHHIDCVVAMSDLISDQAALDFATAFYRALGYGRSMQTAFDLGTTQIDLHGLQEQNKPKLITNTVEPAQVFFAVDADLPKPVTHQAPKRMAPNPPADFVARPTEYNALRELLLSNSQAPVGITAAIRGAGGYGKTTLAQALCHDPAIIDHFPDGIFWVELTQDPGDLTGRVLNLVENLIDYRPGSTSLDAATGELIKALGDKKLLLVIDDAWQAAHITPFLQGGPHCTRLITTRINTVLSPEAPRINVDAMQSQEATQLLGAGLSNLGEALDPLATRLGEWPLLLRIINAVLRQWVALGARISQVIADVNQALDDEGFGVFYNTASPDERHATVAATINVSLRLLTDRERQLYQQLAIFPYAVDVPLATVAQLWRMSQFSAKMLCTGLADLSLLLRFDLATNTIRLHDVVRTYLCKAQSNLATLHSAFLDSYKLTHWTALPADEPYLWDRLAYHLAAAQRTEELTALFADDHWLQVRVAHDGYLYDGYLADLRQSWQQVHTTVQRQIDAGVMPAALSLSVHHALILTSINSLSNNYEPVLVARATAIGLWSPERALSTAYKVMDIQKRVAMLTAILGTHQCNEQQVAVALSAALDAALVLEDEWYRAHALAALAPYLKEAQLPQALDAALVLEDEGARVEALAALAPYLRETQLPHALQAALVLRDEEARVEALAALAPYLRETQLPQVLQAALGLRDEEYRARVLATLVPYLSEVQRTKMLPQVLQAALVLDDEEYRARVLATLVPYLSEVQRTKMLPQVLQAALGLRDEGARADALAALAPYLKEGQLSQVLQAALVLRDEEYRVEALAALVPHLSEVQRAKMLSHLLQTALVLEAERYRARALAALAPYLREAQLSQALQAALALRDEEYRARALAALAPYLSEVQRAKMLPKVLQAALVLEDEGARIYALAALAPHLKEGQLPQVLQAALVLEDERYRARALAALAPYLREAQLPQALDAALVLRDEGPRIYALAALVPHMKEGQLPQVLQAALVLDDEEYRARVLAALAPYLSEVQRAKMLPRALQAALVLRDEDYRADALAALAPFLQEGQLSQVLQAALALRDEEYRVDVLAALAPFLQEGQLSQVLQAALVLRNEEYRVDALAALAPYLKQAQLSQVLQAALVLEDEWSRARVLAALVPYLKQAQLSQALQAALVLEDEWSCADALAALAPYLKKGQLSQVLQAALVLKHEGPRANALAALAPYLREAQLSQVLQAALALKHEGSRVETLAALAPYLREGQLSQALQAALVLEDEWSCADALAALAPFLQEGQLSQVLQAALVLRDEEYRADALAALVSYLREGQLSQVLQATLALENEGSRARVLAALVPYLKEGQLSQSLDAALALEDEGSRAHVLAALAPYLKEVQRAKMLPRVLQAALALKDEKSLVEVLAALVTYMREEQLLQALQAALSLEDERYPAEGLAIFWPNLFNFPHILLSLHKSISNHLWKNLSTQQRYSVLDFLAQKPLFQPPLLDQNTLAAIAYSISDICFEWRWL